MVAGATGLALMTGSTSGFVSNLAPTSRSSTHSVELGDHKGSVTASIKSTGSSWTLSTAAVSLAAAAGLSLARRSVARAAQTKKSAEEEASRRNVVLPAIAAAFASMEESAEAQPAGYQAPMSKVEIPDRINQDPYELIGMEDPADQKSDFKYFYMKRNYRLDSYQVMKHMKLSASLDKGTPRMDEWNSRVKREMNDWLALYRRQDQVVGRSSYYSMYSAVNSLASHFTSYGTKFPFPKKKRPRFFELMNVTEKYLEKGK